MEGRRDEGRGREAGRRQGGKEGGREAEREGGEWTSYGLNRFFNPLGPIAPISVIRLSAS